MAAHLTPRRAPADAAKPTLSDGAGSAPGGCMVQGKVVQTHGHRCFSPDPCTEEGRGNGNDLQPLDLF